jgi:NAD(P)-dependent dehydrogenase (short-subunit alcohol dehydrogenase family)
VDVLVNNAGILEYAEPSDSDEQWNRSWNPEQAVCDIYVGIT